MFNPKITKGEWNIKDGIIKSPDDEVIANANETHIYNAKAIAAVPELLEVYRAVKEFSDYYAGDRDFSFTYGESFNPVLAAIKKLEERHYKSIKEFKE